MGSWSAQRKFLYGSGFLLVVLAILSGVGYFFFYNTPTCSDGARNGDERGVDCGGSCKLLCTSDALTPVVLWSKVFNVSGDIYTTVAYVQNPNVTSANPRARYQFRIYDENNKLIAFRDGDTVIPKNKSFAVFEFGIILKDLKPKSADFVFTSFSPWEKDTSKEPDVTLSYGALSSASTTPALSGTIRNNSLTDTIPRLELDAFVMDENGNAIGASQTFAENLASRASQDFVFTWPKPFVGKVSTVNVLYRTK